MKSRSNNSDKDKKKASEAKTFMDIKILFTGSVLWPMFTETEQQINEKRFKKLMKLKNPNIFLKTNNFKILTDLKFQQTALN